MQFPFFSKNKSKAHYYLGILLAEGHGTVLIMKLNKEMLTLEETENFQYSNGWENLTEDIDAVLSLLEKKGKYSLKETIFFVYSHLIHLQTKQIKRPYLEKIKYAVKNLDLKALGFIECNEALVQFMQKKEELPLTATLVEIDSSEVSIYVYNGGKNIYSGTIAHTQDIIADLQSIFNQLKGDTLLPSRMIVYGAQAMTHDMSKIAGHKWGEDLFVQIPRVEFLKEPDIIDSLTTIFEEQLLNPTKEEPTVQSQPAPKVGEPPKEVMGFMINQDVPAETDKKTQYVTSVPQQTVVNDSQEDILEEVPSQPKKSFSLPHMPSLRFGKFLLPLIGLIIIIGGLFLNEYFLHTAVLTVFLPSQTLNKNIQIKTVANDDTANLRVYLATDSADLTASMATTGKKDIGEKAKGEVTLHNFDDKEKIFVKGTTIDSAGIKFVLDDEVKVASASLASDGSAKLPGKNKGKVTAAVIGSEGNIDKGKRFTIEDLPSSIYFAINDNSFSGGTKKTVAIVSKKDTDDLKKKVLTQAKGNNSQDSKTKFSGDQKPLESLTQTNLESANFSKDVGEEAKEVSLKAKVSTVYYYIKDSEVKKMITDELQTDLPENNKLQEDKLSYKIENLAKKDSTISFDLSAEAKAVKAVDSTAITKDVVFKNKNSLNGIVKDKYGGTGYQLDIHEPIPVLSNYLPLFKKNITIKISYL